MQTITAEVAVLMPAAAVMVRRGPEAVARAAWEKYDHVDADPGRNGLHFLLPGTDSDTSARTQTTPGTLRMERAQSSL
jgi:hypothetical protein